MGADSRDRDVHALASGQWALIVFTLAAQTAVGVLLGCWGAGWLLPDADPSALRSRGVAAAAVLLIAGAAAATRHLGRCGSARYALSNLRTSWLGREALLMGLLTGWVCLSAAWGLVSSAPQVMLPGALAVAGLLGVALIGCMARLYMLPAVSSWNRWWTPAEFAVGALLLGTAGLVALDLAAGGEWPQGAAGLLLAGPAGLRMVLLSLALAPSTPRESVYQDRAAPWYALRQWSVGRLVLTGIGTALAVAHALSGSPLWLVAALVLLATAEVLGRVLFYARFEKTSL